MSEDGTYAPYTDDPQIVFIDVERLEYDMLYYENMSLTLDLTILIYTIKTVITEKGV